MFKISAKSIEEKNSIIAALFIFQYSLLIPLMSYINPVLLVGVTGIALLGLSVINNRKVLVNSKTLIIYIFIILALVLKLILDDSKPNVLMYFLLIALPVLPIFSCYFNRAYFLKVCHNLAILNFFMLFWIPFWGQYEYMRFGYGLLLTPVFLFSDFLYNKDRKILERIFLGVILGLSLFEVLVWGARGCIVTFILFFILDTFIIHRQNVIRNTVIAGTALLLVLNLSRFLDLLQWIAGKFGLYSYALRKYQLALKVGLSSTSAGRDGLYREAIREIKLHPLIGNPMSIADSDGQYVHNLFLQVGRDLGIVALILVSVFVLYSFYTLFNKRINTEDKTILLLIFSLAMGRLLFSSVLWKRPEFWMLICFQFVITDKEYLLFSKLKKLDTEEKNE